MSRRFWVNLLAKTLFTPGFWFILALLVLITIPHYNEVLQHPAFLNSIIASFNLERHAFERILFLLPIVWSGFLFGWKGAMVTSLAALGIMLPRAIIISPFTNDAIFETSAVFIIGNVLVISFEALRKSREQRTQLEVAHSELQSHTRIIEEKEKRLATLNQISSTVSQSLELSQVLNSAINSVIDVMRVDAAWIYLLHDGSELLLDAHRGVSERFVRAAQKLRVGEGFSGRVAETAQPIFIEDATQDPELQHLPFRHELHSVLIVPLTSKGKVNGTLGVNSHSRRLFQQGEIELLTAIGNQIGVAVENARLYQEQQKAAQELRVSEQRYRELFENAHDAIWLHNPEGVIMAVNQATEKLTGYSIKELVGMNVRGFLSTESHSLANQIREKLLGNEPVVQPYEQRIIRKDKGEAFVQLTTSLVFSDGKPVAFQHIARDVSVERRLQENLRFYLQQVTRAQEEERKRISRELHDETIQALVVLSRNLDSVASCSNGLSEESRLRLEDLRQQTNNIMRGVRRLSQDLRPAALDRLGLLSALEWLAADAAQYSGIATKVHVIGTERRFPEEVELVLFRITQEAMRNVWRHSQATQAEIEVEFSDKKTRITIRDNGKGFDLPKTIGDLAREGKLGLTGMQERAGLIGGTLLAHSEPGKGSAITVEIPA